jgi:hypothetical protein
MGNNIQPPHDSIPVIEFQGKIVTDFAVFPEGIGCHQKTFRTIVEQEFCFDCILCLMLFNQQKKAVSPG